jgi:predicted dehydrogenase
MNNQPNPLKWGLIGCGDIARKRIAPALRDLSNSELVAVCRADSSRAEAFAHEFGASKWYGAWQELVADPEIDAVYVATPVHLHAEQAIAAAAAGKHVLCEKPMALNVAECDRMLEAAASSGVHLGVAYYRRFYPVLMRVGELLRTGAIGRPVLVQMNAFEWFDPGPDHPRRWLLDRPRSGGGPLFDFGCHRIELLTHLFGTVDKVRGLGGQALFDREVEDTATAILEFTGGMQAVLSVTHAAREPQDTLTIFGSQGTIEIPELNAGKLNLLTPEGDRTETHPPPANLHLPLIDDFARAVIGGRTPEVDGHTGRETARLVEEIYLSAGIKTVSGRVL